MELAQGPPLSATLLREKLVQHVVTEHFLESGTVPGAGWHPCSARFHAAGETEEVQVKYTCLGVGGITPLLNLKGRSENTVQEDAQKTQSKKKPLIRHRGPRRNYAQGHKRS